MANQFAATDDIDNNLNNNVDTAEMLGLDALGGALNNTWQELASSVATYGPNLAILGLLLVLYMLIFWGASQGLTTLLRRFLPQDAQVMATKVLRTVLRLTLLMLFLMSATALFEPLRHLGAGIFRGYLWLLFLYVGWGGIERLINLQTKRWELDASLSLLLGKMAYALWFLVGTYMIFQQFGINLLPILGGLGVVGLAVGFAAQDILSNLISGITLLLDRPFKIGDWIRVSDHEGQVNGLTLRTTRIRTRDNEYVNIPNKDVAAAVVVNLSQGGPLRMNVVIGIAYKENVEQARKIIMEVLQNHTNILQNSKFTSEVLVNELSASSVDLLLRFWISQSKIEVYPMICMQIKEQCKEALQHHDIGIPFPHLQLHIDEAKGLETIIKSLTPEEPKISTRKANVSEA